MSKPVNLKILIEEHDNHVGRYVTISYPVASEMINTGVPVHDFIHNDVLKVIFEAHNKMKKFGLPFKTTIHSRYVDRKRLRELLKNDETFNREADGFVDEVLNHSNVMIIPQVDVVDEGVGELEYLLKLDL